MYMNLKLSTLINRHDHPISGEINRNERIKEQSRRSLVGKVKIEWFRIDGNKRGYETLCSIYHEKLMETDVSASFSLSICLLEDGLRVGEIFDCSRALRQADKDVRLETMKPFDV